MGASFLTLEALAWQPKAAPIGICVIGPRRALEVVIRTLEDGLMARTLRHPTRRLTRARLLLGCLLALGTAFSSMGSRSHAGPMPVAVPTHH